MYRQAMKMQAAEVLDLIFLSLIRFSICLMLFSGSMCGRVVNSSNSGVQASPVALFPQTRNFTIHLFFLCSSRCINGYRRHTTGGNPEMDQHPIQRGEAILLNMLHAEETGILSSGRLDLWLVRALTLPYLYWSLHDKLTKGYFIRIQRQILQRYIY